MRWKDFFYFQKQDRSAIVVLLILIVVVGIAYIITTPSKSIAEPSQSVANARDQDNPKSKTNDNGKVYNNEKRFPYAKYTYQEKLKVGEVIDLNSADTTDLKKIPGIGSSYANRIVKYRTLLGGYTAIGQLYEVYGMDNDLYQKIMPYITINNNVNRLKVNSATFQELNRHPYISYQQAKIIVDIRTRKGTVDSLNRLALLDEFTEKDIKRLSPYLSFE